MSQNAMLFAGDVYLDILDQTGASTGFVKYETDKLSVNTPSDLREAVSRGRDTYGQTFASIPVAKPTEFAITLSEVDAEVLAMKLAGTNSALSQSTQTLTDVPVTAIVGKWVELGYTGIAATGFAVKDSTGTTTYVEGTDYLVNRRLGLLQAIEGGSITDAASVKVTGTTTAATGTLIKGATRYQFRMRLRLDGINLVTNKDVVLEADEAIVSPSEAQEFFDDKLATATLKGRLQIPDGQTEPFRLTTY